MLNIARKFNFHRLRLLTVLLSIIIPFVVLSGVNAAQPTIQAVLFYSPTCPHCHEVMENVLPPIIEQYPNQLDIVGIDVSHPVGLQLYQTAITTFNIPENRLGVPTLIVASEVLVGSDEIAIFFPQIVESGLVSGGIAWPEIPGLSDVLAAQESPANQLAKSVEQPAAAGPGFIQKFFQDPLANTIAVIVLIGMILCAIAVLMNYLQGSDQNFISFPEWALPAAAILGFGVAFYMSYVELTQATAVCGPVGNCNSVQESPYAILFGFLPIGVLGVIGYLAILVAWLMRIYGPQTNSKFFTVAIWGMAWFGVLFATYLTFLEPFVIGATCAWCITNSILISAILLFSTQPAKEALKFDDAEMDDEEDSMIGESLGREAPPPTA